MTQWHKKSIGAFHPTRLCLSSFWSIGRDIFNMLSWNSFSTPWYCDLDLKPCNIKFNWGLLLPISDVPISGQDVFKILNWNSFYAPFDFIHQLWSSSAQEQQSSRYIFKILSGNIFFIVTVTFTFDPRSTKSIPLNSLLKFSY